MTHSPTAEMRSLVDRLLDQGGLSGVEAERLEKLLENRDALRYYSEVILQESLMAEALEGIAVPPKVLRFPLRTLVFGVLAVAACLMISLFIFMAVDKPGAIPQVVYTTADVKVTAVLGVAWENDPSPVRPNGSLAAEHVVMRSGLLELTYPSGVRVRLQGPTDYRVKDINSGILTRGRLVAHVPPGAGGFTVDYGTGRVVDLGTEFGLGVHQGKIDLSVFDGTVEMHLSDGTLRKMSDGQSLRYDEATQTATMEAPADPGKFVRSLPADDFPWEIDAASSGTIEFDVTSKITKPSKYLAVFKWMDGAEIVKLTDVELRRDGKTVVVDPHPSLIKNPEMMRYNVRNNLYVLDLRSEDFAPGRWTVHARTATHPLLAKAPAIMHGMFVLEEGLATQASPEDFIGRWSFNLNGKHYIREFHKDGRVSLEENGIEGSVYFAGSQWSVKDGVLEAKLPALQVSEYHILRNPKTLIFTSNPYENAVKIEDK